MFEPCIRNGQPGTSVLLLQEILCLQRYTKENPDCSSGSFQMVAAINAYQNAQLTGRGCGTNGPMMDVVVRLCGLIAL